MTRNQKLIAWLCIGIGISCMTWSCHDMLTGPRVDPDVDTTGDFVGTLGLTLLALGVFGFVQRDRPPKDPPSQGE